MNLEAQTVGVPGGETWSFDIDPVRKKKLLEGLDDIGLTLAHAEDIHRFESAHYAAMPWLPGARESTESANA